MAWSKGESGNPNGRPRMVLELREIRRLAQARSKDAYLTIEALMVGADKDSTKLAAAIAVLKFAGMPMSEDRVPEAESRPPLTPAATEQDLLEAASEGES